ncbi:MAG: hypothetical protein U0T75_03845 [Chitinophagales bacterium]
MARNARAHRCVYRWWFRQLLLFWDNGATYQPTSVFSNLPAGSYNIVVKDGNNCTYAFPANPVVIGQ